VISYGVEIWGWREREGIERLQDRFLKWLLGVESFVPGYMIIEDMIREELQRDLLRGRAGMGAWSYENKLRDGKGGELARECLEKIRNKVKKGKAMKGWEEERVNFIEERRWKMEEIEEMDSRKV